MTTNRRSSIVGLALLAGSVAACGDGGDVPEGRTVLSMSKRPVMLGVQYFQQLAPAWGETMAYSTMITIPVLIVFLAFQRNFVKSIASTGVKG